MFKGLGILLLIILFFWLVWPAIARWLKRKAIQKTNEYIWRKMGMEPPPSQKKRRKEAPRQNSPHRDHRSHGPHEPIIPKEYAEDVEFVETIDYSETEVISHKDDSTEIYHESQISDAEWVEIKPARSKQNR